MQIAVDRAFDDDQVSVNFPGDRALRPNPDGARIANRSFRVAVDGQFRWRHNAVVAAGRQLNCARARSGRRSRHHVRSMRFPVAQPCVL